MAINLPSIPGGSSGQSSSSSSPTMIPGMMGVYNQLLAVNQQHYGNVLGAYQQGESTIASQSPQIAAGYAGVNAGVQNQLGMGQVLGQNGNWGVAQAGADRIRDTFAQQQGQTTQQMTNAGLGNTTAVGNMQNQNSLMAGQAYGNLANQLAGTAAGYTAQEGNASLASRMQGLGMQANLYGQALGPLGQQFANTAGALSGQSSTATSSQQAQPYQGSTQSAAQQSANNPLNNPGNLAGQTGAAVGNGPGGGGGAASGSAPGLMSPGGPGSGFDTGGGYNPVSAYGAQGGLGSSLTNGGYGNPVPDYPGAPDAATDQGAMNPWANEDEGVGGYGGSGNGGAAQGPGSTAGDGSMGPPPYQGAQATYASTGQGANQHPVQTGWH